MAGLALVLELLSKQGPSLALNKAVAVHSFASLSAFTAATTAASAFGILPRFTSDLFSGDSLGPIALCEEFHDKDTDLEDWKATTFPDHEVYTKVLPDKPYAVTLKPFFSAFSPAALSLTIMRALLLNFQPVLEGYFLFLKPEDEDEFEEEEEPSPKEPVDYKTALKGSGWTILREVTVVTTRRLLERIVVRCVSKRITWKLLKDLPRSAERKAGRHLSKFQLFVAVKKTTFRGHAVAIAASWLVQLALDIYSCIRSIYQRKRKLAAGNTNGHYQVEIEELTILWRKIVGNTVKCGASLVCASVGAGLGAVMIRPTIGQWIGCTLGELAGALGMSFLIDPWIVFGTLNSPDVD